VAQHLCVFSQFFSSQMRLLRLLLMLLVFAAGSHVCSALFGRGRRRDPQDEDGQPPEQLQQQPEPAQPSRGRTDVSLGELDTLMGQSRRTDSSEILHAQIVNVNQGSRSTPVNVVDATQNPVLQSLPQPLQNHYNQRCLTALEEQQHSRRGTSPRQPLLGVLNYFPERGQAEPANDGLRFFTPMNKHYKPFTAQNFREDFRSRTHFFGFPRRKDPVFSGQVLKVGFCQQLSASAHFPKLDQIPRGVLKPTESSDVQIVLRVIHNRPLMRRVAPDDNGDQDNGGNSDGSIVSEESTASAHQAHGEISRITQREGDRAQYTDGAHIYEPNTGSIADENVPLTRPNDDEFFEQYQHVDMDDSRIRSSVLTAEDIRTLHGRRLSSRKQILLGSFPLDRTLPEIKIEVEDGELPHFQRKFDEINQATTKPFLMKKLTPGKPSMVKPFSDAAIKFKEKDGAKREWRCLETTVEIPSDVKDGVYEIVVTYFDNIDDEWQRNAARSPEAFRIFDHGMFICTVICLYS
jgi:hypothetical protein